MVGEYQGMENGRWQENIKVWKMVDDRRISRYGKWQMIGEYQGMKGVDDRRISRYGKWQMIGEYQGMENGR